MAAKTKGGLLLVAAVVVGGVALGGQDAIDTVTGWFGGTEIIGEGDTQLMIAGSAESKTKQCTAQQMITQRRCGDLKVLPMDAAKMPFIARNIRLAWGEGKPFILHRNSAKQPANRAAACGRFVAKYPGGSCDEYAFATTDEGGADARIEEVPIREQRCQGGAVNAGYAKANIQQGDAFLVVISNPGNIADKAFTGPDIAKDKTSCEI